MLDHFFDSNSYRTIDRGDEGMKNELGVVASPQTSQSLALQASEISLKDVDHYDIALKPARNSASLLPRILWQYFLHKTTGLRLIIELSIKSKVVVLANMPKLGLRVYSIKTVVSLQGERRRYFDQPLGDEY